MEITLLFIFLNLGKNMKKFRLFNSLAIAISLLGLPAISSTAFGADDVAVSYTHLTLPTILRV